MGRDGFLINKENVDLRYLEQIADGVQMTGIAKILDYLQEQYAGKEVSVDKIADELMKSLEQKGIYGTLKGSGGRIWLSHENVKSVAVSIDMYGHSNPKIQLEPLGERGYIELCPVKSIDEKKQ